MKVIYCTYRKVLCDLAETQADTIPTCTCSRCKGKYMLEIEEEEFSKNLKSQGDDWMIATFMLLFMVGCLLISDLMICKKTNRIRIETIEFIETSRSYKPEYETMLKENLRLNEEIKEILIGR